MCMCVCACVCDTSLLFVIKQRGVRYTANDIVIDNTNARYGGLRASHPSTIRRPMNRRSSLFVSHRAFPPSKGRKIADW